MSTVERGELPVPQSRKVAFLFTGLSSVSPGLAAALYRRHPVFAEELDACDRLVTPLMGRSVKSLALGTCGPKDAEALREARYAQPVQFAVEYALAKLWMSWGIRPNAVAGHSMGEIAAGAVAGLFSLPDAARLITARARLTDSVRSPGRMVSVGAAADVVAPLLADHPDVTLAAINAPQQCVISGGRDSMAAIVAVLSGQDIEVRALSASTAFHSPLMAEIVADLREAFEGIRFAEPAITMVSTVTGQVARPSDMTVDYWVRHVLEPVNFMGAMRTLDKRGKHVFVEIGPAATLTSLGKRCVPPARHVWLASMHPSEQDGITILEAVAKAYAAGQPISWPDFHRGPHGRLIELLEHGLADGAVARQAQQEHLASRNHILDAIGDLKIAVPANRSDVSGVQIATCPQLFRRPVIVEITLRKPWRAGYDFSGGFAVTFHVPLSAK